MWMRRNASVRNGGQQEPPFNPNHRRYRTCCCHCKTFTLGFGIVELFLICFMLVAVAPDFNSKICAVQHQNEWNGTGTTTMTTLSSQMESTLTSTTSAVVPMGGVINSVAKRRKRQAIEVGNSLVQNPNMEVIALLAQKMSSSTTPTTFAEIAESEQNGMEDIGFSTIRLLRTVTCSLTALWLAWAILQMCSIGLMCYGVKRQRWQLLIPHIFLRICCIVAVWLCMAALIGAFVHPAQIRSVSGNIALCVFLFLIFLWLCILLKSEIRCCEFIKRSAETGFSISNTRPIGPPTVSQSDSARGDHVRRVVQTGIRKMPIGPSARRYQQSKPQQNDQIANGCGNNEMATMSTLATGAGGAQTRPSTAGSLATALAQNGGGQNGSAVVGGASRGSSAATTRERQASPEIQEQNETDFGGQLGEDIGNGQPPAAALPPLRHTYKMGG